MQRWRAGDAEAGRQLFARHFPAVRRFFRNKVDLDTHDLVQRTFLTCLEHADALRNPESFRPYLFSIAHRELIAYFRRLRPQVGSVEASSIADLSPSPSAIVADRERQRVLLAALRQLPLELQVALELHYWEELTAAEIGEVLDLPVGTAKTRIRRAKELLRALVEGGAEERREVTLRDIAAWAREVRGHALPDSRDAANSKG